MTDTIASWRTDVGYKIPGVDTTECDAAVLKAALDFCSYTKIWTERLFPMDIVVIEAAGDIVFNDAAPATITSDGALGTDFSTYFAAGDIIVTNHQSAEDDEKDNTGPYLIATAGVAAATLTLATGEVVVADTDVSSIYISKAVYALTSSNGDIVEATHVKLDGKVLDPKGEAWLDENIENWRIAMGSPEFFTVDREKKLRLIPVPNELIYHGLEVWVSLKPIRAATTFPDFIFDDWFEAISDGAVAELLSQTSKPWRDFEAAGFYWGRYASRREDARTRARLGHSEARSRMTA